MLKNLDKKVKEIIINTTHEYGQLIFNEALSKIPSEYAFIKNDADIVLNEYGFLIYFDGEWSFFVEMGTGTNVTVTNGISAAEWLAGKPQWYRDEAMKAYKNGQGTIPASPYLFPTFMKYYDLLPKEIDKRLQSYFNSL